MVNYEPGDDVDEAWENYVHAMIGSGADISDPDFRNDEDSWQWDDD
jgi:hypothetical protein